MSAGLIYGQVKKGYRRRRLVHVSHVMRCGTRAALKATLTGLGLSGRLNTAFAERVNLTVRQSVAALMRRTWSTLQEAPQLLVHLEWWRGYYHFARPTSRYDRRSRKQSVVEANGWRSGIASGCRLWRPG